MSKEKIYPQGVKMFNRRENAPSFVKGTMVVNVEEFAKFINENQNLLSEYNGKPQLKLNVLEGDKGLYLVVDTYKKQDAPF